MIFNFHSHIFFDFVLERERRTRELLLFSRRDEKIIRSDRALFRAPNSKRNKDPSFISPSKLETCHAIYRGLIKLITAIISAVVGIPFVICRRACHFN